MGKKILGYFCIFIIDKFPETHTSMDFNASPTYMTRKPIHFRSHYQAYIFNAYRLFFFLLKAAFLREIQLLIFTSWRAVAIVSNCMTDFPITNLSTFFDIVSLSFMGFPVMGKKYIKRALKGDDKSTDWRHNKFLSCDKLKKYMYIYTSPSKKIKWNSSQFAVGLIPCIIFDRREIKPLNGRTVPIYTVTVFCFNFFFFEIYFCYTGTFQRNVLIISCQRAVSNATWS